MTEPSARTGAHDDVMAQFLGDLERRGSVIIDDYKQRYPHLAPEFDGAVRMQDVLGDARHDPLEVPERLGEFRLVRRLSTGGMGELYEAEQERVGRRVVVKIIRRGRISPQTRDRFLREQEVLAKLHQTNIVPIYAAGEEGRLQYYAMPYIDGAALDHVVRAAWDAKTAQPGSKTPTLVELAEKLARPTGEAAPSSESSTPTAAEITPAAGSTAARLTLSPEYFRSVAQALADAAEAVHHAHIAGILHRDLKPSNVMVDRSGHCWVIDFGLAGYLASRRDEAGQAHAPDGSDPPAASGMMGTPNYMAPEQFDSKADARSDVWALGATLYELLTLRRAFDGPTYEEVQKKVLEGRRMRVEELTTNVPPDLAAICRKAMRKEPQARYATAQEFADDLRRWLWHEPTKARGAWAGRRAWLWGRRNPGWATSLLTILVAAGVLVWLAIVTEQTRTNAQQAKTNEAQAKANEQQARADAAEQDTRAANERERQREFELSLKELQRLRLTQRTDRWFAQSWALIGKAADIHKDANLKNEAAAALSGLGAVREKEFPSSDTSWVAFDSSGDRLLLGAAPGSPNRPAAQGAKIWDLKKADLSAPSKQAAAGPVAFRRDGTPIQLVPGQNLSLQLWDVLGGGKLQEYRFSAQVEKQGMKWQRGAGGFAVSAMTPDGSRVGAAAAGAEETGAMAVWDGVSGKRLLEVPRRATALAFDAAGTLCAAADGEGNVTVWALPEGTAMGRFRVTRERVDALSFSPDAGLVPVTGKEHQARGRIAVGAAGGSLDIWDLRDRLTVALCRGSQYHVYCTAFSPDGTLLASGGREAVHLWDATTGRMLLSLHGEDWVTALAFSPDGERLVTGGMSFHDRARTVIWKLEDGRGILTLRGLTQPVAKICLSPDGGRLAALAQNWEVGVWELPLGRLRRRFRVPPGLTADNAALAFNRDGTKLAVSSFQAATLWEVDSGHEAKQWSMPRGFVDLLAFDNEGRLLLFRAEQADGDNKPQAVYRVRNLLGAKPLDPIASIRGFNRGLLAAVFTPDGRFIAADGLEEHQGKERWVRVFEAGTGKQVWAEQVEWSGAAFLATDPAGQLLAFQPGLYADRGGALVEFPSGKRVVTLPNVAFGVSPRGKYTAHFLESPTNHTWSLALHRGKDRAPLFTLGIDVSVAWGPVQFDREGNHVVWGNVDGNVSVADLVEVQRRLAEFKLGWE